MVDREETFFQKTDQNMADCDEIIRKLRVSTGLTVISVAAAVVFSPAIGGALVGVEETIRQSLIYDKKIKEFPRLLDEDFKAVLEDISNRR